MAGQIARLRHLICTRGRNVGSLSGIYKTTIINESKCWSSTDVTSSQDSKDVNTSKDTLKMNKAMKAYQERARQHDAFMLEQSREYEIGKRHLANIMGEDPEMFTQDDVDEAIKYLFPSGLFEPRARPLMKPPDEVFPKRKDAEFDEAGRPFHTLFYTGLPGFYQVLHDLAGIIQELDRFSDRMKHYSVDQTKEMALNVGASRWVTKEELEKILLEKLKDKQYDYMILSLSRVLAHPYSYKHKDFIMKFRKPVSSSKDEEIPKLQYTSKGIPYMTGVGKRKTSEASVTVYGRGSGQWTINSQSILYFTDIQAREQVMFPLQFTEMLGKVDVIAEVEGGGSSGQAGAIRLAISQALRSFVSSDMVERMRLAGLLTRDPRRRERKKPGQKGARAKFTWKKR